MTQLQHFTIAIPLHYITWSLPIPTRNSIPLAIALDAGEEPAGPKKGRDKILGTKRTNRGQKDISELTPRTKSGQKKDKTRNKREALRGPWDTSVLYR